MTLKHLLPLLAVAVMLSACNSGQSAIMDPATKAKVEAQLLKRSSWTPAIPADATQPQREALSFLYAYMPVGDAADYPASLFEANVNSSLEARQQMSWGDSIPQDLFLHFVLPVRVNNETLDTSRLEFYNELKDRVKGMSMSDAILEVNHWCHEKVVYTPSDARTSAPSASVCSAYGRCGEESTFTVAALRSVGIPARQVYTPRWAHTDDNHAWVEAWADGKWHYLGACEPEPVLNTGWFDAPAKRGMLMHTKVFGDYTCSEEVLDRTDCYTEINVTSNYAPTATAEVTVLDADGLPVKDAQVIFSIYNYAEFYPAAYDRSDESGKASLSAGLGTLFVWATDGARYGYVPVNMSQATPGSTVEATIQLINPATMAKMANFTLVPPADGVVNVSISPEQRALNNRRLAQEDSIRGAYTATFFKREASDQLAAQLGVEDTDLLWKYISASRGNWAEIEQFLRSTPKDQLPIAMQLLGVISLKDLRDTPASVLGDHLSGAAQYASRPFFVEAILNPRIDDELLTAYRNRLNSIGGCGTVEELIAVGSNIALVPELNPAGLNITPMGVQNLRKADTPALERYIIALLRSKGIPARREPLTERPQYYDLSSKNWVNINLSQDAQAAPLAKGSLLLSYTPTGKNDDPKYSKHFTIASLNGGTPSTIDISGNIPGGADMGEGVPFKAIEGKPIELESGAYMLVTGTRMANGTVLNQIQFFDIVAGEQTPVKMQMLESEQDIQVIGSVNSEALFTPEKSNKQQSILSTTGRGYFVVALLDAKKEPTTHALRDIAARKAQFEEWGRGMVMLFRNQEQLETFDRSEFPGLPSNITFGVDNNGEVSKMLTQLMEIKDPANLPIFIIGDTFNRVVFFAQGYQIGLGEQMLKVIDKLK